MRLKNIILTELAHERLIAYEKLERVMNDKNGIQKTKKKIRHYLKQIVQLNAMINEWESINQEQPQFNISDLKEKLHTNG